MSEEEEKEGEKKMSERRYREQSVYYLFAVFCIVGRH